MKILAVNWLDKENPQAGGAEIHFFEIFRRLVARGHQVTLVASGWPDAAPRAVIDGIDVYRFGGRHSFAALGRRAIRTTLRDRVFDLVVEDVNKLPLYVSTLTRLPIYVIVPHLFGSTVFREAAFPVATLVWLAERPIPTVYRRAAFHAISDSTRDDLVSRGVPSGQIRVIYPGVDSTWFTPDAGTTRAAQPTFLYVGRLKRYKGIDVVVRAVAELREQGREVLLQVVGRGDDQSRLHGIAADLGVSDRVEFLGFVSEENKRDLLRRCWSHVFPSVKEGWGISNVEAAACGSPAIASRSPGLRESVRDGETGILVTHDDPHAWADAMATLCDEPSRVEEMGTAGRSFAESLTWDRAADQTEAHLAETLEAERTAERSATP